MDMDALGCPESAALRPILATGAPIAEGYMSEKLEWRRGKGCVWGIEKYCAWLFPAKSLLYDIDRAGTG